MIPVLGNLYHEVNLNPDVNDTEENRKYKDLLNKEYSFCIKIIDKVIEKANRLYKNQMGTGKVQKFCCNFKLLENVYDTYR